MLSGAEDRNAQDPLASALHLARRALRFWKGGAVAVMLGLGLTAGALHKAKPVYRSETVVLYRNAGRQNYGEQENVRRVGARMQDLLFTRERFQKIIRELRLYPGLPEMEAVEEMRKETAFRVRDGSTFLISFDSNSPDLAQAGTKRLGDGLIEENTVLRVKEADEQKRFLDATKKRLESDLRLKEEKLADLLRLHPDAGAIFRAPPESGGVVGDGGVSIELQIVQFQDRLKAALATPAARAAATGVRIDPASALARTRAEAEVAQAERNLAEQREKNTDAHPDLRQARVRLAQAQEALRRANESVVVAQANPSEAPLEASDVPSATGETAASLRRQIGLLQGQLSRQRRAVPGGASGLRSELKVRVDVQWQALSRDAQEARERLADLGNRQFQADLLANVESSTEAGQMVILDPAFRPATPVKNLRPKLAVGGFLVALILGMGWAFGRATFNDQIFDAGDVERMTQFPVLATVRKGGGRAVVAGAAVPAALGDSG